MNTQYTCPVCAYSEMPDPAEEGNICPCCGTEFGYDDDGVSHRQLRDEWVANGAPWFSTVIAAPINWSPWVQLILSDYDYDQRPKPRPIKMTEANVSGVYVEANVRMRAIA